MALTYDDSGFYYFSMVLMLLYMIPVAGWLFSKFLSEIRGGADVDEQYSDPMARARTAIEREKVSKNKEADKKERLYNPWLIGNVILLAICTMIFVNMLSAVSDGKQLLTFNPYSILEIDESATSKDIKRSYRKLSLKYHPDRNSGDKDSTEKFQLIAKAYESLTDEVSMENWKKYGNPDGRQPMDVSIGLPSFLRDESNQSIVLLFYFLLVIIAIPAMVIFYYQQTKGYRFVSPSPSLFLPPLPLPFSIAVSLHLPWFYSSFLCQ